ncbi:MAG: hypothetical protein KUG77_09835 [Nannocystaceae bacterium]|nr:hypothetical protein [Nannocystaceae bacterium]
MEVVSTVAQAICGLDCDSACLVLLHDTGSFATKDLLLLARAPDTRRCVLLSGRDSPSTDAIIAAGVQTLQTPLEMSELLFIVKTTRFNDTRPHRAPRRTKTEHALPRLLDRPRGWSVRGEFQMDSHPDLDPESVPRCMPSSQRNRNPVGRSRTRETLGYLPPIPD